MFCTYWLKAKCDACDYSVEVSFAVETDHPRTKAMLEVMGAGFGAISIADHVAKNIGHELRMWSVQEPIARAV